MPKEIADFSHFEALVIRIGTILEVSPAATRKPTWRMLIDFGPEIGRRVSCGAYTNYPADGLPGRQVVAVVNFVPRQMGPERSEALVLGIAAADGNGTIFLSPDKESTNGAVVF